MPQRSALVTGAAGFIGAGAAAALSAAEPGLAVRGFDRTPGCGFSGDIVDIGAAVPRDFAPEIVVHCAGITTSACEASPEAAFHVNVEGTRALLRWCAGLPRVPHVVFTSSIAVFGGGEAVVDEDSRVAPASTYGAVKAMAEQLVLDASRRGAVDGVVVRLPVTIVRTMRSGRPGAGYLSDMIIHAVAGRAFTAPLPADQPVPVASSRRTFAALASLALAPLPARLVQIPSISGTGRETLGALRERGIDPDVTFAPDPAIAAVMQGWPSRTRSRLDAHPHLGAPAEIGAIIDEYRAALP